jgi:hypothetical protein
MNDNVIELGNWMIDYGQEWSEWFQEHWNWKNFTLIKVYYEDEICMGNRELTLALLGFWVRIQYLYDRGAKTRVEIEARVSELLDEHDKGKNTSPVEREQP